jgi:hypothetical protein
LRTIKRATKVLPTSRFMPGSISYLGLWFRGSNSGM